MTGTLFIVATPIGNLDDITFRAVETLNSVDIVLAEDTRHSKKLLKHLNIEKPIRAFYEHNEREKMKASINKLHSGKSIALISDAGTPLISDPGFSLVAQAKKEGLRVVPIPGASALIASDRFTFFGFLPSKKTVRIKLLKTLLYQTKTSIFYESPKRIFATLTDMHAIFGSSREVCLAKELTKVFETIRTDSIPNLIHYLNADENNQKGEFVILISANDKIDIVDAESRLDSLLPILCAEMGASKAAKLAAKITGVDKKICYKKAIDL